MAESSTDATLRERGLTALEQELGPVQALRFLAMISRQPFDYQDWRHKQFDGLSLTEILSQASAARH
jgi:hypothetical protein